MSLTHTCPGCDKASFYEGHAKNNASPALQDKIRAAGTRHDITFRLSAGATGPSRNSHKLIALALQQRDPAAQARGVEHRFRGHFERGVRAVPCVTMQGRYRVGGYQEQGVFENLFDKILKNGGS